MPRERRGFLDRLISVTNLPLSLDGLPAFRHLLTDTPRITGVSPGRSTPLAWVRSRARALRHVAWRDTRIRSLEARNEALATQAAKAQEKLDAMGSPKTDTPSFYRQAYAARRIHQHLVDLDATDRGNVVESKLEAYSFAQSHGVRVPTVYGLWDSPEEITWDELPDHVVIKSDVGAHSRGVFPLHRTGNDWTMVTKTDPITPVRSSSSSGVMPTKDGSVDRSSPRSRTTRDGTLPTETRVFAFYGEVGLVNVRKPSDHGNPDGTAVRRFLPDGTDGPRHPSHDDSIELPEIIEKLVDTAKKLSLSIPMAFVRIDMFDIAGQVVLVELTPRPGGTQDLGAETDARMGELWERAQARVVNDVIDGGDYRLRFGP